MQYFYQYLTSTASLSKIDDSSWSLDTIYTPINDRCSGQASKLLKLVLEEADRERITLVLGLLTAPTSFGLRRSALEQWYRRYGFFPLHETNYDLRRLPYGSPC